MTPREVIIKYVEAFNHVDIDMLTELYADDAVNHQVVTDPVTGKLAIGRMLREEFAKTPMVCIVENIFAQDEWVVLEWKEPHGFRGCEVFQVIGGKIKLQRGYYDTLCFRKEHPEPSNLESTTKSPNVIAKDPDSYRGTEACPTGQASLRSQ